jgi:alpha-N-arabinofuranosidase
MKRVKLIIEKDNKIGEIGPNLFGSFLEHLGRAIYTGIYEPDHFSANEDGFRTDVADLVRELQVPIVRYPGGNFVSNYRWTDGIGEKSKRPRRLELAWQAIETNEVGIDEFAKWAELAGVDVMPAVNMGTAGPQEAAEMLEYCNFPGGTYWSDLRRQNGREKPYRFRYWCIGNEMDGPWQIGNLPAEAYGYKAAETIKMMRRIDPEIKAIVTGSSSPYLPTYPEWDRKVLEITYDWADFISLHRYYDYDPTQISSDDFLHSYLDMDRFITEVISTADYVKAQKRSNKTILLSFDEWNIWHSHAPIDPSHQWATIRPILEDNFTARDALLFSGMMMTLINHADRVKMGCLAQLVNVLAPIMTKPGGGTMKQTIFYPYLAGCRYAKGEALHCRVSGEKVSTRYGDADLLYTAAAFNGQSGEVNLFILNPTGETIDLDLTLAQFGEVEPARHLLLDCKNLDQKNTFETQDAITFSEIEAEHTGGQTISPYSFHMLSYRVE